MQPARFRQVDFLLVEINYAESTSPAVSSGEERGLLSRTAAGNRAYVYDPVNKLKSAFHASVLLLTMIYSAIGFDNVITKFIVNNKTDA